LNWIRIRELVRKEFIQLFRDRKNRPILVIAPIIQLLVFGYVVTTDVRDVRVGLFDQARTRESRMVMDAFDANRTFRITRHFDNTRELEKAILARSLDLTITLRPDFSERIRSGETAHIQILADGSMSNMASVRIAYTSMIVDGLNSMFLKELYPEELTYGRIDDRIRTWYNPNLDSQNFYVPGVVAFLVMLLTLLFTSMAVIREREAGTMEQLIVTPLKPIELILGKTIPYAIIALAQMVVVTLFAVFWFAIPLKGSVTLLFVATCLFLLSTIGVGLFISTVSSTQQQAMMTTFLVVVPAFLLSGFIFPVINMPTVIQWLVHLNPLMHFLIIIRGIFLKGVGIEALWDQMAWLFGIGMVLLALATNRFRKRLD
jgi:ABC-2 type transport system permease protein